MGDSLNSLRDPVTNHARHFYFIREQNRTVVPEIIRSDFIRLPVTRPRRRKRKFGNALNSLPSIFIGQIPPVISCVSHTRTHTHKPEIDTDRIGGEFASKSLNSRPRTDKRAHQGGRTNEAVSAPNPRRAHIVLPRIIWVLPNVQALNSD